MCRAIAGVCNWAVVLCTPLWLGCGPAQTPRNPPAASRITTITVEQAGRQEVACMEGTLTFERRNGQPHGVLAVKNDSDKTLWVPLSPEAINFSVDGGLPSLHLDFSLCAFPTDYVRLRPTETHRYVQRLPDDAKSQVEMEVWAPWRASDGQSLVDAQTIKAALKANEILVERIVGVGQFE